MTPIEAATNAVRSELAKMAHDPKEIARLAVKAYLESASTTLASTGEHAVEDFFTTPVMFPTEPAIRRVPPVFLAPSEPEANNVVQVSAPEPIANIVSTFTALQPESKLGKLFVDFECLTQPEYDHGFRTADLLALIPNEIPDEDLEPMAQEIADAEDERVLAELTPPCPGIAVLSVDEIEVITWLYTTLVNSFGVEDNTVLDLSRTLADYGLDSLDAVELVMTAEEDFDIFVDDVKADRVVSIYDLVQLIAKLKG